MNLLRLDPPIYLLTPLGDAEAHFLQVPEGFETSSVWGCFQCETKENWWWPNQQVRLLGSLTAMRSKDVSDIFVPQDLLDDLRPHILRHKLSPFNLKLKRNSK